MKTVTVPYKEQCEVTFYSPGMIVSESSTFTIESWDVDKALQMLQGVTERHGAKPFGFRFSRKKYVQLANKEWHAYETAAASPMHYVHGKVLSLADVEREQPDSILQSNMRCGGILHVVETSNGYSYCAPLEDGDVVFDKTGHQIWP